MIQGTLKFAEPYRETAAASTAVFAAAVVLSALLLLRLPRRIPGARGAWLTSAAAAAAVLAGLLLLRSGPLSPYLEPLLQGGLLTAAYGLLSLRLGRTFGGLAIWMLALTLTAGTAYLGYAPVLLPALGGLSLAAVSGLILLRTRERT